MKKKLLVVNLQDPSKTEYKNPKEIGTWILGRRTSNYILLVVEDNNIEKININAKKPIDSNFIQKIVNLYF